jgi:hypothetical protein
MHVVMTLQSMHTNLHTGSARACVVRESERRVGWVALPFQFRFLAGWTSHAVPRARRQLCDTVARAEWTTAGDNLSYAL